MLSIAVGSSTGYLTREVAQGRENYYTGAVAAGEPAGRWFGAGAEMLGLVGEVDADQMNMIYEHLIDPTDPNAASPATWGLAETLGRAHRAKKDPEELLGELLAKEPDATPERRAELARQAERAVGSPTMFLDATVSASKSVTLAGVAFERRANECRAAGDLAGAAMWAERARVIEDALEAGGDAALAYLQDAAGYGRVGHHGGGAGRWIDAHQWVVATFVQHDNRDHAPALHRHQAILNRQLCVDGVWRALDTRAIHRHRGAAAAIAERVMEAYITAKLGLRFETRPDGKAREIVGVSEEMRDLFSSRRRAISKRAEEQIAKFRDRFGREPKAIERTRILQQATLSTRARKLHIGETEARRLDRWQRESESLMVGGLSEIADAVLEAADASGVDRWSPTDVIERALHQVADTKSAWTRSDLTRAISDALPGQLGIAPERVPALLHRLTGVALDYAVRLTHDEDVARVAELQLENGRSVYAAPGGELFAAPWQLAAEQALRDAAMCGDRASLSNAEVDHQLRRLVRAGVTLSEDQEKAVRGVLSSGSAISVLAAPAGTGKSYVTGAINAAWTGAGHSLIGLAASQAAAGVLQAEGVNARNTAAWLSAQRRLEQNRGSEEDQKLRLGRGSIVAIDESSMADTPSMNEVRRRVDEAGARLFLIGDPPQLQSAGPGGMFNDLAKRAPRYNLTDPKRFSAPWESDASLLLRDGDSDVVTTYAKHGRVRAGGTAEQTEAAAVRAWLADHLSGRDALLLVPSNEMAARVGAAVRAELVSLGKVSERGVPLHRDGTVAGVGDRVQARRNGWELAVPENPLVPINRLTYTVVKTHRNGSLTVERDGEWMLLPADYVQKDVSLAYASTVHGAQGRTVDVSHAILDSSSDLASTYVSLSRGRDSNVAWMVTRSVREDAETGEVLDETERTATAVFEGIVKPPGDDANLTALAEAELSERDAQSFRTAFDRFTSEIAMATRDRFSGWLDRLAGQGALSVAQRQELANDTAAAPLERLLRQAELAGHNPEQVLTNAVTDRSLDNAVSVAQTLHYRVRSVVGGDLAPKVLSATDFIPRTGVPERWSARLQDGADAVDARQAELGSQLAAEPATWALQAAGPVPNDPTERLEWEAKVGLTAAYREHVDHDHDTDILGNMPAEGLVEANALFRTAHTALGLPEIAADEAGLTDAALRARVKAMERERNWEPPHVADELRAAEEELADLQADAVIWRSRAEVNEGQDAEQLVKAAETAEANAVETAAKVAELTKQDKIRADYFAATAPTRDRGEGAKKEAARRGVDLDKEPEDLVSADEWLAAHEADMLAEDPHREIGEDDIEMSAEEAEVVESAHELDTAVADARDTTEADPVQRSKMAVAEMQERDDAEKAERMEHLRQWHAEDVQREVETVQEQEGPALERAV